MRLVRAALLSLALADVLVLIAAADDSSSASSSSSTDEDSSSTTCWVVDSSESAVVSTYSGSACPIQVDFTSSASVYAVNATLSLLWGASLLASSSNDLDMPLPPPATVTISPDNVGKRVQIVATYARTCSALDECDPTVTAGSNFTSVMSGNFTGDDQDEPVYFPSIGELWYSEEGAHVLSAVAMVSDDSDSTLAYYFASFIEVQVVKQEALDVDMIYDKTSTYCRETSQSPLDDTLLAASLVSASSSCEVAVTIDSPDVVQAGATAAIKCEAVLDRNSSAPIQLPSPLVAVDVTGGNGDESAYYTIASAVIKLCSSKNECNEYSEDVNVSSKAMSANFSDNIASFTASGIVLPDAGWYSGVAQITLGGEDDDVRYDFMSYFNILATQDDEAALVESEAYVTDGSAYYCWEVVGTADASEIDATSVYALASNGDCPYAVSVSASNTTLIASNTNLALEWSVIQQSGYSQSTFSDIDLTAVYNASADEYVELAQANVYVCNTTSAAASVTSASCSPFAANKTTLYSAQPANFSSDGEARFSVTNLALSKEGTYTIVVHAVIANGDDSSRVDVASFMTIQVSASSSSSSSDTVSSSSSSTGTLIGVFCGVIGGIVLIALAVVIVRRRRRKETSTDDAATAKSGMFGFRPLSVTNELPTDSRGSLHSNASEESGSFLYVKAQRSPVDETRYSSLSYDPYSRKSFTEMANDESPRYSFVLSDQELSPAPVSGDIPQPSTPTYPA